MLDVPETNNERRRHHDLANYDNDFDVVQDDDQDGLIPDKKEKAMSGHITIYECTEESPRLLSCSIPLKAGCAPKTCSFCVEKNVAEGRLYIKNTE